MIKKNFSIQIIIMFMIFFQFGCGKNNLIDFFASNRNDSKNVYTFQKSASSGQPDKSKINKNDTTSLTGSEIEKQNGIKSDSCSVLNSDTTTPGKTEKVSDRKDLTSSESDNASLLVIGQTEQYDFSEIKKKIYMTDKVYNLKTGEDKKSIEGKEGLKRIQERYNNALALYDSGKYEEAKKELRISLVMIADQDMDIETLFRFGDVYKDIFESTKSAETAPDQNNAVLDTTAAVKSNILSEEKKILEELDKNVAGYDFPVEFNQEVETCLNRYMTENREKMAKRLARSTRYISRMKEIFKNEGLPQDLAYLPLIESEFKIRAYSRAGAAGLWQFMRATGKKYKLHIDWAIDERYDPEAATKAAACYLKDLYKIFDSWLLAEAAYNAGEFRILRAMGVAVSRDFWTLAKKKVLPVETRRYVADFMANLIIAKNPEKYGFTNIEYEPLLEYDEVTIEKGFTLSSCAKAAQCSIEEVKTLNPALIQGCTPVHTSQFVLKIPKGRAELFKINISELKPISNIARAGVDEHIVRSGESMSTIAVKYGIPLKTLAEVNNISNVNIIKIGMRLIIPSNKNSNSENDSPGEDYNYKKVFYTVQKGDTLWDISKKYNVTINKIIEWNKDFKNRSQIYPGEKISIWIKEEL
ncbi:LysM peptidoglycan-binding domain-containing protein [Candidatus Desantisbacteria bacterium]|nr:LysM peptidoglycan-binding domain-containing protein [Candidatus Desantisbacteria bacterium]